MHSQGANAATTASPVVDGRFAAALRRLAAPLGVSALWAGLAAAARAYPTSYDWRSEAISALLYPADDPRGYLWACAGVELCGMAGVIWTAGLNVVSGGVTGGEGVWDVRLLRLGFLCMCLAVLPDRLLPLPKAHELFAIVAFVGIGTGMLQQMLKFADVHRSPARAGTAAPLRAPIAAGVLLVPCAFTGLTLAYLALVRVNWRWLGPVWRAHSRPRCLSFAPWEWGTCALLSLYLLLLWHAMKVNHAPSGGEATTCDHWYRSGHGSR